MKNILFISHSSNATGGGEDDYLRLIKYFKSKTNYNLLGLFPKGEREKIFSQFVSKFGFIKEGYFPIMFLSIRDYFRFIKYFIPQFFDIYRFVNKNKVDLCVVNVSVFLIPGLVLKMKGLKTLIFIRENVRPIFMKKIIYKYWNFLDAYFICHTKEIEAEYKKLTGKTNINLIRLAIEKQEKHAVLNSHINHISEIQKFLNSKHFKIVSVGPISDLKNQKMLIESLILLKENFHTLPKIIFVGKYNETSEYFKILKNIISDNELDEYVMFSGEIIKENVYYIYSRSDALVITSLVEGFGLTMVEAMNFKLPVISTPVGVMPEIITNGYNGFITDFSPDALKSNIVRLMLDVNLKKSIGENGFKTFLKEFDLENNLYKTKLVIEELAGK